MRYNVPKSCAALLCRACKDFPVCVAEHYLTLRTGCSRGRTPKVVRPQQRKNPLPFPLFAAVAALRFSPDSLRERGDPQEGGNRRCLPSCAPARRQRRCLPSCAPAGQARFPRFASDTLPFCTRTQKRNTAASQCPSLRILLVFVFLIFLLCGIGRTAALFCAHRRRCLLRFNERVCLRVDTLMPAIVVRIHGQTALF